MKRLASRIAATSLLAVSMLVAATAPTAASGPPCTTHAGDVDDDGYADVMVAQPLRTTFSPDDGPAGAVDLLRGSSSGITGFVI